jgi:hypothetical protein
MSDYVNVELVEGTSYTTLTRSYKRGEVYRLTRGEYENIKNAEHLTSGKPVFKVTNKDATLSSGETTERQDVVKGGGITITHNVPKAMSPAEMEAAGLGAFARQATRDSRDVDTGAGVGAEDENYDGPSGHDGLDDEPVAVGIQITHEAPVAEEPVPVVSMETPEPVKTATSPVVKKPVVLKKGSKSNDVVKV